MKAGSQCFPLYWYEENEAAGGLFGNEVSGGYTRHDAITDQALEVFRKAYPHAFVGRFKKDGGEELTKLDIFFYVYGILHSPEYRSRFAANLKKELPRIPLVLRESGSGTLEVIAAALAARGIRLSQFDVTMRLGSTEGIKAFVRNSDAMAIVSVISVVDELRSGALRIVDIEGLTLSRDFVFVHAEAEPARLARRFIDFARADF